MKCHEACSTGWSAWLDIRSPVNEFIIGIVQGEFLETIERFYDEKVVVNDNGILERKGKPANLKFFRKFLENIDTRKNFKVLSVLVDGPKAMIEWSWDFTPRGGNRIILPRLILQTWVGRKITYETWYHQQPLRYPGDLPTRNQYVFQSPQEVFTKNFRMKEWL